MWRLARSVGLDLNSPYAYVLWGDCFDNSSIVAVEADDTVIGFVIGFHPPRDPSTLFVWQIGVAEHARERGVARRMLDDLVARSAARWLEATVTQSNTASTALFRGAATRYRAAVNETVAYPRHLFPGGHETEMRFRIGPLVGSPARLNQA
jgi:L-2,4-diaminobutyric acid acetyltransferase